MSAPEGQRPGPCVFAVYGAGGDLTRRKLFPALYNLGREGRLPADFAVVGFANREYDHDAFREEIHRSVLEHLQGELDSKLWGWIVERTHFVRGEFGDPAAFGRLAETLADVDRECGTGGNYLHYLASPPQFFGPIVERLDAAGLAREADGRWRRVSGEKRFGHDLESAQALNAVLREHLEERQIYRIDHYLGKETVQNILVFRFANSIFEPIWNRRYIDHVQITVAEELGVEHRGGYYDGAGALRDMVPNHLFQLLALTTMEPPVSFEANAVRGEKAKVLQAIQPLDPEDVLACTARGQYGAGELPGGQRVPGYREEPRVDPRSGTETYVAMRLLVDNWRWVDVPFYLRTGKRLPRRVSEISIHFKHVPFLLFRGRDAAPTPNVLVLRIQPDEGISLHFGAKVPGAGLRIGGVDMDFCNAEYFGDGASTGYETLLYDCMKGDATLFQRADNVELAWSVAAPVLDVWRALTPRRFPNYPAGSWGPAEADELLERDGRAWRNGA